METEKKQLLTGRHLTIGLAAFRVSRDADSYGVTVQRGTLAGDLT